MPVWIGRFAHTSLAVLLVFGSLQSLSAQGEREAANAPLLPGAPRPAAVVSSVANPGIWEILGTEKFSPAMIRRSVVQHPEYLELSYPDSNAADFVAKLKQLIERGYRHKGFAEVSVAIGRKPDDQGLTIRIHEGPRYKSGGIEIVGARKLDSERIIKWCRTVVPKVESDFVLANDKDGKPARVRKLNGTIVGPEKAEVSNSTHSNPMWRAGENMTFARSSWDRFNKSFKQSLEAQGFYHVKFECLVVPDPKTKTGTLRVLIHEEGPQVRAGDITVEGLAKIDRQRVLNYVGLKPGQPVGSERCREIEAKLSRSGRFVRYNCLVVPRILEPEVADVFIDVRESKHAVPLNQKLTEPQQTMVRLSDWIENRKRTGHDLILQLDLAESLRLLQKHDPDYLPKPLQDFPKDIVIRVLLSPKGDMLVERRDAAGKVHAAILMAGRQLFLRNGESAEIVDFGDARAPRPMMQLLITGLPDNPATNESSFAYGIGVQGEDQESTKIRFHPAAGIRELGEKHIVPVDGKPGEFAVPGLPNSLLKIDPVSGRLIDARFNVLTVSTRRGEFQKELAATRAQFERLGVVPRQSGEHEAWGLIARAASRMVDRMAGADPEFEASLMNRLADQQVWQPMLRALARLFDDGQFTVPADGRRVEARVKAQLLHALMASMVNKSQNAAIAQFAVMFAQMFQNSMSSLEIFPYASIPWQLNRDVELLLTDRSAGTVKLNGRLQAGEFGPVSGLYASLLMSSLSAPLGKHAAAKTLTKLDNFRLDRDWLLTPGSLSEAVLLSAAQAVRRFNPEETVRFVKAISGQDITLAQAAALRTTLPGSLAKPVEPAMKGFSDALWQFAFRPLIRNHLEQFILNGVPTELQAKQMASWAFAKQKAREYDAAGESFRKSLSLYKQHLKEAEIPRDSRQAYHIRATLLYMLAMNHDLRTARRAELLQIQIELGEAVAERLLVNAGVQQTSLDPVDEQAGVWQLARLYAVSGVVSKWLGQDTDAHKSLQKALALYKNRDAKINGEYAVFVSQYALLLATSNAEGIRNMDSALKLAKGASDLTRNQDTDCLAIYAAVLAASGDHLQAYQIQQNAIGTATTLARKKELEADIAQYRAQKSATAATIDLRIDIQKLP